jgi:hypothetical protein
MVIVKGKIGICLKGEVRQFSSLLPGTVHVDIKVSYKILRLDVLKETPILHNLSCFR